MHMPANSTHGINAEENTNILFYILVPVYNVEKYLSTCIESVLNQTYPCFQLILVDDGSPDDSGRICEEYAKKDSRIKVIHQTNYGLIGARQTAVQRVREIASHKNEFVMYLDSDDSYKPYTLEKIAKCIQKTGSDMVIFDMERVADGKTVIPHHAVADYTRTITEKRELYNLVFNNSGYNSLCRKAISIELLPEMDYSKYFHISHAEDLLQSIWYYKYCKKASFLNESLYNYTINPDSITQTVTEKNFTVDFTVRQRVYEFLIQEDVFKDSDWRRYRSTCIRILLDMVQTIMRFPIERKQKTVYLDQIRETEYYKKYISSQSYDKMCLGRKGYLLYLAFEKQRYLVLYTWGFFYSSLRKMKMSWRKLYAEIIRH